MEHKHNGNRPNKGKTLTMNKPRAWSHQDELTRGVGRKIVIQSENGAIEGVLLAADQFSVKVALTDGDAVTARSKVVFKSAIRHFEVM